VIVPRYDRQAKATLANIFAQRRCGLVLSVSVMVSNSSRWRA